MFSLLNQVQDLPILMVQYTLAPLFVPSQPTTRAKPGNEPPKKLQHREVSIAEYCTTPEPRQFKRCNDILRSLSLTDNLGSIPQIFQALDETFFNGRVSKVANAVGVRSKSPYTAGVGGYIFRDAGDLVIRLPTWTGKTTTLHHDLNILFREMAFIDFYMINTCRCDDCLCSNSGKVREFVEYLTRLDKLANLHLEGFQKQWNIREDDDFEMMKRSTEEADRARKVERATQTPEHHIAADYVAADYARCVEQLEEATQTSEALASLVDVLRERAEYFEEMYRGVLECTRVVEEPQRCRSLF